MKCRRCKLAASRLCIVRSWGPSPAPVLFLVEGPTEADERFGEVGRGPDYRLLGEMVAEAADVLGIEPPPYHVHPIVLCRPCDDKMVTREPARGEVLACAPNVLDAAQRIRPAQVFFTSKLIATFYGKEFPDALTIHPLAGLERQGGRQSPWYLTNIRTLIEGFKNVPTQAKEDDDETFT